MNDCILTCHTERPEAANQAHRPSTATSMLAIPEGHVGPISLPGTGRLVYWTGRVAIGLRHEPPQHCATVTQSALWVQDLMLAGKRQLRAA